MSAKKPFPVTVVSPPYTTIHLQRLNEIRSLSSNEETEMILLVTYDEMLLFDREYGCIVKRIKRLSSVRSAIISANGRMILCHFTDNTLRLISTRTGNDLGQFIGLPPGSLNFNMSQLGNKIVGGNNKILCIWQTQDFSI